jgi:predicted phosphodiesterase
MLVSQELGLDIRGVYNRRSNLEKMQGIPLPTRSTKTLIPDNRRVISHEVQNGSIFIASDCHYWPGEETVAHKAFVKLVGEMKPTTIVLNGDVFDGAQVSRHPPLMGVVNPTPKQEIEACQDRLSEIANASKNAKKFWTFGNHDTRLFSRIAASSPELTDMMSLFDYFPGWTTGWRIDVNADIVIKHRWHNGQHATYNNILKSGSRCVVTGHLHKLQIYPWSDYTGRKYGVDSGTLAEPYGDQFVYTESNPVNWCSGFAVLTIKDGVLLPPELCEVINGVAYFRGKEV